MLVPLAACRTDKPKPGEVPVAAEGEAKKQIEGLSALTEEYDRLQREISTKSGELDRVAKQYLDRGGVLPATAGGSTGNDLTPEQLTLLTERLRQEKGNTKSLLQAILDQTKQIEQLRVETAEARASLPEFVDAKAGDRHEDLVRAFLMKRGTEELVARRLAGRVNLQDPLAPGHRVWFYYRGGQFATWVTQGNASISPQDATRQVQAILRSKLDAAASATGALQGEVATLTARKAELESSLRSLEAETDSYLNEMAAMKAKGSLAASGARYLAGSKRQLKEAGVIGSSLLGSLRLKRLEEMQTLELATGAQIVLDASTYGLDRIKKITILPEGFKRDSDYSVLLLEGGAFAKVSLLERLKFRNSAFVIVVE